MARNFDAFIFDLDGTLLNSLDDLADAANEALAARGLPGHPVQAYRFFIGNGTRMLMRRAAPEGTAEPGLAELVEDLHENYAANWADKTRPYVGIVPMLGRLSSFGLPMAVLSNKPHDFTTLCVGRFFPDIAFDRVQGCPEGGKPKPDPSLALDIAGKFGVQPERVLFLGDSSVDMDTARAAGMTPAGALWGFRTEEELKAHGAKILIDAPEQIFSFL